MTLSYNCPSNGPTAFTYSSRRTVLDGDKAKIRSDLDQMPQDPSIVCRKDRKWKTRNERNEIVWDA
jgi:hypothetical protein